MSDNDHLHPDDDIDTPHGHGTEAPKAETGPAEPKGNGHDPARDAARVDELAAMEPLAFGRIAEAEAAQLGVAVTFLKQAVSAARSARRTREKREDDARKAREKDEANVIKKREKAEADAIKKQEKDEAEARKQEKAAARAEAAAEKKAEAAAKKREKQAAAEAKTRERLRKLAEAADRKKKRPTLQIEDHGLGGWTPPQSPLPEIIVEGGERPAIADAGLAAMKAAGVPFYQRGKDLVRICLTKLKLSNGEDVRVPAISTVTRPMLLRALGHCATWWAYTKTLDLVQIDPPGDLADHILGMVGEWQVASLRGVIATQTMCYDGTLLTKAGYDPATGLVLFNSPKMADIPKHPTKADALEALALLNDLLTGFEFEDNVSRSGAVSMLMTPVLRGMMPAVPIHFITKPDAGSGGSYLQDLMSAIAIGERCPTISLTLHNDEENEKRLSSAARTGQPIIAIDNFTGTLMGNFFCQLIERPMPQIRILGKTELETIPNNHTVVANGINISIGTDAVRRGVQISLDPNVENPSERSFTRDPVAEVLANRGPAVRAILIMASAYRVAGMPGKLPPRPSFEVWSDNVRSVLVWLGWPDPDLSIQSARTADPHQDKLVAVMTAWATELTVGIGYRTSELIKEANAMVYASDGSGGQHSKPELREALFAVAGTASGQLDATRLGNWLRDHKNRIAAGHKLINDTTDKQRPKWKLEPR